MLRKASLACGVVSSPLYVAILVLAPALWVNHSSASQTVSELFAIGAPSRPIVVPLLLTYDVLVVAFGLGGKGDTSPGRS